ncbi:ABC transporter permease [Proteiniclasticum ruminis]|uniref:ABC transporter permease n=1 Tax=Proteiniclasticum ruminis TaxID=398199 RepID=UPI0028A64504|nr:ABC transporter permease [Proteiniclasticum ruminis]
MGLFYFKRSMRDVVGHLILIALPVVLIAFFDYIYRNSDLISGIMDPSNSFITVLTIGFTLTFQIYGGALTFETIGSDFFTPMKGRLLASPKEPRSILLSILLTGILVSFIQTAVVVLFSIFVLEAEVKALPLVLLIMLLSIIFNQLLGTTILLLAGKVKTATTAMSLYGAVAPIFIGIYFPLPDTALFRGLRDYLTPMAFANRAVFGAMEGQSREMLLGVLPMIVFTLLLIAWLKPLTRKVML